MALSISATRRLASTLYSLVSPFSSPCFNPFLLSLFPAFPLILIKQFTHAYFILLSDALFLEPFFYILCYFLFVHRPIRQNIFLENKHTIIG